MRTVTVLMSRREIAQSIMQMIQLCKGVVAAFTDGSLPAPPVPARCNSFYVARSLRAAPFYARGRNLKKSGVVLYTSHDVAEALKEMHGVNFTMSGGNAGPQADRWISTAMAVLEFCEEHPAQAAELLAAIARGDDGFQTKGLLRRFRAMPREGVKLTAEEIDEEKSASALVRSAKPPRLRSLIKAAPAR